VRLRRFGRNALLALGSVLFALGMLEAGLRLIDLPIEIHNPLNGFHQGDSGLGWAGKPDIRRRFRRLDFDVMVEHGPDGFRRGDPTPPPDAARRILFLGDSFTWGWGVGQGEVLTDLLQRALGPSVAVVNRGVNAYGTGQEYLLLRRELARARYDLVVLLFFQNDVPENLHHGSYRPYFELVGDRLEARNQPTPLRRENAIKLFFKEHSQAFSFLNVQGALLKARWKERRRRTIGIDEDEGEELPAEVLQRGLALTRRLLLEMGSLARQAGGRFVLAYVPAPEDLPGRPPEPWGVEVRQAIAEFCAKNGIPLVDLTDGFRQAAKRGEHLNYPRDGHWTAAGHRLASELLLQSGLLANGPPPGVDAKNLSDGLR
jgi:lysophospholipase L1-like esterase